MSKKIPFLCVFQSHFHSLECLSIFLSQVMGNHVHLKHWPLGELLSPSTVHNVVVCREFDKYQRDFVILLPHSLVFSSPVIKMESGVSKKFLTSHWTRKVKVKNHSSPNAIKMYFVRI
jgi:hypothetical protein